MILLFSKQLRLLSNDALVASFQDEEVGFLNGRTLSPDAHMTINTDVVANYIANAYSDRTPRIFAATAVQQDILHEILVAYLLYRHLRCRVFMPRILKESASFLKSLLCIGKSSAAVLDEDLESSKLMSPIQSSTRRTASY